MSEPIRLTQYSHGAGCGCKISPQVLEVILAGSGAQNLDPKLWVGNSSRDDAAVYALDDERGVVSTTDFFMPIVDDPYDFGRIAATNAISDIYAMGGDPLMAIAILGWPVNLLPPEVAREVIRGGRAVCDDAGIPLAGGHSIDTPEPIFGLAVTGVVNKRQMKRNDTATAGCLLYLTKPLGIGILTTAEKKGKLRTQDVGVARDWMCTLNRIGSQFAKLDGVTAMTDVTGFGLLGHLVEMADGSGLSAQIDYARCRSWTRWNTTWSRAACRAAPCATMTVTRARFRRSRSCTSAYCAIRKPAAGYWSLLPRKATRRSWTWLASMACTLSRSAVWWSDRRTRLRLHDGS